MAHLLSVGLLCLPTRVRISLGTFLLNWRQLKFLTVGLMSIGHKVGKKFVLVWGKKIVPTDHFKGTMKIQIIKNYWDMEIIGNRRKRFLLVFQKYPVFRHVKQLNSGWANSNLLSIFVSVHIPILEKSRGKCPPASGASILEYLRLENLLRLLWVIHSNFAISVVHNFCRVFMYHL